MQPIEERDPVETIEHPLLLRCRDIAEGDRPVPDETYPP
jgi:hypothetical protein